MHARQLAEIGSWVAVHSSSLVFGDQPQTEMVGKTYWTASKCRIQRWITALKMFEYDLRRRDPSQDSEADGDVSRAALDTGTGRPDSDGGQADAGNGQPDAGDGQPDAGDGQADSAHDPWPAMEIVVQEILLAEVLTRIWSAAVVSHDFYHRADELHGLAHGIHISHLETKNRALRLLLKGQADNEAAFDRMNRLRRRVERWTDLFLGQLPQADRAATFGFQPNRVNDFAAEQRHYRGQEYLRKQQVLMASMAADLAKYTNRFPANPALNWEVASGVLACFPADRFDTGGLPKSARMLWIEKSSTDTQMLIDQLIELEDQWFEGSDRRSPM